MTDSLQLVWLRNDLRLLDNPPLYRARQAGPVVACFAVTKKQWQNHNDSPAKLGLCRDLLLVLQERLAALNIALKIIVTPEYAGLPKALTQLAKKLNAETVWWSCEYPLNEARRDQAVAKALQAENIGVQQLHGDLIHPPGSVRTGQGQIFQVFTPFAKRWRQISEPSHWACLPKPKKQSPLDIKSDTVPPFGGDYRKDLWPSSAAAVSKRLNAFCENKLLDYTEARDFPGHRGTSLLSPYLTLGAVSVRQCLQQVLSDKGPEGFDSQWVTELIWREFYRHLIATRPKLSRGFCFKSAGEHVRWARPDLFASWCQGQTGFPIVDAGMRQLQQTGWMHNRVRMITAAFLTKLLLIDWHLGEAFFMQQLIDGDFASNNGGWQWSASVGADAAPYFRIFNPYRQAERFDPAGDYVRKFVPELASLPGKKIHQPTAVHCQQWNYPHPIIDYALARETAMAVFVEAFKN